MEETASTVQDGKRTPSPMADARSRYHLYQSGVRGRGLAEDIDRGMRTMRYQSYQPPYTISEVIQMRLEGQTYSQIANHFGISSSRVGHIVNREKQRQQAAERSAAILNEIRTRDGIDRNLTIPDLFCVLNLSKRAEAVLKRYFNTNGTTEFSLRNMMDFLLPVVHGRGDYIDYLPGYRVKTLGIILYTEMVKGLSDVDAGESFQREWTKRKEQLRDYFARRKDACYGTKRWANALA